MKAPHSPHRDARTGPGNRRRFSVWIAGAILTCSPLVAATSASAKPVACVQNAIDWSSEDPRHSVGYALVALHKSAEAIYAAGTLTHSTCPRELWAGSVSCLVPVPQTARDGLLLHPNSYPFGKSYTTHDYLPLSFQLIPGENEQEVHLHQPNAMYDFYPRCIGDLLVGDDQWGNHWTVAFRLLDNPIPR
jgi:hypothetical protein